MKKVIKKLNKEDLILLKKRKNRIGKLNFELKKIFPEVRIALSYGSNWELLVAVILSAQCTDKKVNEVTDVLFKKYKKFDDYLKVTNGEFEVDIRSTGFYKNKTKNILNTAKRIQDFYNGNVPNTMEDLLTLPGVARKTANVVLGHAYGIVEGVVVDTHVIRFVTRFNLSDSKNATKIEQDLMKMLSKKEWKDFTHRVIAYGRTIAPARKYDISIDPLIKIYPEAGKRFRV